MVVQYKGLDGSRGGGGLRTYFKIKSINYPHFFMFERK